MVKKLKEKLQKFTEYHELLSVTYFRAKDGFNARGKMLIYLLENGLLANK